MNKFLIIFFSGLISLFFACKPHINKENDLIGTWRVDDIKINQEMSLSQKANFNLYLGQLRETSYFIFRNDHKYESSFNENISKGRWELANKGQLLVIKPDESDADSSKITELNATTFIILSESDGVTSKIVMKKQK